MSASRAGDIVLTRLEANRHRVLRSRAAGAHQRDRLPEDRRALAAAAPASSSRAARPGRARRWSHLRHHRQLRRRQPGAGRAPDRDAAQGAPGRARPARSTPLMARRLGGSGGISRRGAGDHAHRLPRAAAACPRTAARGVGDAITQLVHLSLLDLAGLGNADDAARGAARAHQAARRRAPAATPSCRSTASPGRSTAAGAICTTPSPTSRDGVAGYILRAASRPAAASCDDRAQRHRSITEIALACGFSSMAALQPRVPRAYGHEPERVPGKAGATDLIAAPARLARDAEIFNHSARHGTPKSAA